MKICTAAAVAELVELAAEEATEEDATDDDATDEDATDDDTDDAALELVLDELLVVAVAGL